MTIRDVGLESNGFAKLNGRIVEAPELKKYAAEVVVAFDKIRIECQRPLVVGERLDDLTLLNEHGAPVAFRRGIIRVELNGSCEIDRGLRRPPKAGLRAREIEEGV